MKCRYVIPLSIASIFFLVGCNNSSTSSSSSEEISLSGSIISADTSDATSVSEASIEDDDITSDFVLTDPNGSAVTASKGVYTLNIAGAYVASGKLSEGQLYIDATDKDVELVLDGASISNSSLSPIYATDCSSFELKAKKDSTNYIYDNRTTDYSQTTTDDGQGAVFVANGNLKVTGQGSLYVYSKQNSGVHGKDDVKVKNLTLIIRAQNNGIKGNDKVIIEENPNIDIYSDNNGIVTSNSNNNNSNQKGYIYLNGGTILINSNGDGIDAAYSVEVGTVSTYTPEIAVYTGKYSAFYSDSSSSSAIKLMGGFGGGSKGNGNTTNNGGNMGPGGGTSGTSAAEKDADTAKGIKAANAINIQSGSIYVQSYDDSLHADSISLENGSKGSGAIAITGGTIKLYASDDALHADGALTISGGSVSVIAAHEGVEGKNITISGGSIKIAPVYMKDDWGVTIATDDAINATSSLTVTGGFVDAAVNPNGDYDCLDSNGTITISGGIVIARGPNSGMAGAIDADGKITVSGGTLIYCGSLEGNATSISPSSKSISVHSSGSHTITIDTASYTITNSYSYASTTCYSNSNVSAS